MTSNLRTRRNTLRNKTSNTTRPASAPAGHPSKPSTITSTRATETSRRAGLAATLTDAQHPSAKPPSAGSEAAAGTHSTSNKENSTLVDRLRGWRRHAWEQNMWPTAAYWGNKILTMGGTTEDVYWQAKIYFALGEYAHADSLLDDQTNLVETSTRCKCIGAQSAIKLGKWDKAEKYLRQDEDHESDRIIREPEGLGGDGIKLSALFYYLQGVVASHKNERTRVHERMKKAVVEDPKCIEAFRWLVDHHAMDAREEEVFVNSIPFDSCGQDAQFLRALYLGTIKKYDETQILQLETVFNLAGNVDILLRRAERLFEQCKYDACYEITSGVIKSDPFNLPFVPLHVSCLSELGKRNDLFYFAHQLVDNFPAQACTWYAVGAYYLLIQRNLEARKYFSKSTMLDGGFGPGWLGFAHSFAAEGETDQAISAYSTAAKLFNGMHIPLMHLGMHYILVNNLGLGSDYLHLAESMNSADPMLMNELGVLYSKKKDYGKSIEYFEQALKLQEGVGKGAKQWEATWYNLGLAHYRLQDYAKAKEYAGKVLEINYELPHAHALMGFIAHAEDRLDDAIEHYSNTLSFDPDDIVCQDLMKEAIADAISHPGGDLARLASGNTEYVQGLEGAESMGTHIMDPNEKFWLPPDALELRKTQSKKRLAGTNENTPHGGRDVQLLEGVGGPSSSPATTPLFSSLSPFANPTRPPINDAPATSLRRSRQQLPYPSHPSSTSSSNHSSTNHTPHRQGSNSQRNSTPRRYLDLGRGGNITPGQTGPARFPRPGNMFRSPLGGSGRPEDTSLTSPSLGLGLARAASSTSSSTDISPHTAPHMSRHHLSSPRTAWPPLLGSSPAGPSVPDNTPRRMRNTSSQRVRGLIPATPSDGDMSMDMEIDDFE